MNKFKSPFEAYYHMLKNPNSPYKKQAEKIILIDSYYSYLYVKNIIKSRFPKGEKSISTDPLYSCLYARYILKSRFPKVENIVSKSIYLNHILNFNHE